MSTKPTIVLVPGAWHSPECFQYIVPKLEALSYPVACINLATVGEQNPAATHLDDVAAIHEVIIPLMNEGKEVMLIPHSYGAAVQGQTVAERSARGEKGGITSIFFLASFALKQRYDLLRDLRQGIGELDGCCSQSPHNHSRFRSNPSVLYNDLSPEQATYWLSKCRPHTLASFGKPVEFVPPDLKIPSMYLICEKDGAMDLDLQESLIAATPGMKTMRFSGGHSPFLSHPDFTVEAIVKAAKELGSDRTD
ncbi:alpha/beta-hydrolase [Mollisia scopiformis]|uniref:Alpha/beta-hydrolase n=1 Tax=Mollisia scopiformis TaxID=149040 RepID=A0A132BA28_MOLSC|nr:alpha/beta-hydrolase [Mollisia scopiformis]KUJ09260.1 alpha/beta-hydrolase [Mollisia scopiformis]